MFKYKNILWGLGIGEWGLGIGDGCGGQQVAHTELLRSRQRLRVVRNAHRAAGRPDIREPADVPHLCGRDGAGEHGQAVQLDRRLYAVWCARADIRQPDRLLLRQRQD